MKKSLLSIFALGASLFASQASFAQTTYIDEVFTSVLRQSNIVYDSNRSVNILYGQIPGQQPIIGVNLTCDIYTPVGGTGVRPTIIIAHTGSYLPVLTNKQATGNKNDSAVVDLCNKLAKRGYTVVAANYRLGWNALATVPAVATEQLLQATYRGIQDMRNCIRFIRSNASTYGVDTSKIIVGGQGTGGYIALALGSIDKPSEIEDILKFQRGDGSPMVSTDTLGDWHGMGGNPFFNVSGTPGVSGNAHMVFNFGGAMGDLSWLESTSLPVVSMQVPSDPFAPYNTGNVIVPTTGVTVIPSASGAGAVIPKANTVGVNNKINSKFLVDPISLVAMARTSGVPNLYPVIPPTQFDGAPWEWWDRAQVQSKTFTTFYTNPIPANGREADSLSFVTNPTMSAVKGRAFVDTIVKFITPRIAVQFDLVAPTVDNFRPSFGLITPVDNTVQLIKGDSNLTVNVTTDIANTTGFGNITYTWKASMASNVNFASPMISATGMNMPNIAPTYKTIANAIGAAGINIGDTAHMVWTVEADLNGNKLWASDTFNIDFIHGQVTALKEIVNASQYLTVFPNPTNSVINVNMDGKIGTAATYQLIDITGRTIMNGNASGNNFTLQVSGVNPGLYFVQVTLTDGSVAAKRVVIK